MKIRNRLLRAGFGLAALGLALTGTACNGPETGHSPDAPSAQLAPLKPRLDSDMANLVAAIVVPTQMESFKTIAMGSGGHPLFRGGQASGAVRQHGALLEILRQHGVRLLEVQQLLQSALENARKKGKLADWLRQTFPHTADQAIERLDELTAESFFAQRDDHFYLRHPDGSLDPLFSGFPSMFWARDFAISTPRGIIVGNGLRYSRSRENSLIRLLFQYADELQDFPIAFDAAEEGVFLDGGDTLVLDERTLLVGVGNRSSPEAAPLLAKRLGMDVIAVQMPPRAESGGLRRQLLHLDTIFNLVDEKTVLAVPFFLEERYSESNPIKPLLEGLARQSKALKELLPDYEWGNFEAIEVTLKAMPQVGWVTRYQAKTGEAQELKTKLVDFMRSQGYRIVFVGGDQGDLSAEKYALERALYELRWQGGNVFQLAPGKVAAFEHNHWTNQALRQAGIEVLTFDGELLSIGNGGPHCLVMPLVRGY